MMKVGEKNTYSMGNNIRFLFGILFQKAAIMRLYVALGIVLTVLLPLVSNLLTTVAVACVTGQGGVKHFLIVMSVLIGIYGLADVLSEYVGRWTQYYIGYTKNSELLMRLVDKSLTTDFENIEAPEKQKLWHGASHAVNEYRNGVDLVYYCVPELLANGMGLFIYTLTIGMIDIRILVVILIMSIGGVLLERRAREIERRQNEEQFGLWGRMFYLKSQTTALDAGKDIRIYSMADWFCKAFDKLTKRNREMAVEKYKAWMGVTGFDYFMSLVRDLLAYGILVGQVLEGSLTVAEFTFGLGMVAGISNWIRRLRNDWSNLAKGNLMVENYRKMLDVPDTFLRQEGLDVQMEEVSPVIQLKDVSFSYEEAGQKILKNINVTIAPGEKIALVGNNGAGKTTLVKLLCGFYHPTEGEILVGNHSIEEYNLDQYQDLLSVVFQEANTVPMSIATNISGKDEAHTDKKRVWECLEAAGLAEDVRKLKDREDTYIQKTVREDGIELSGGMLQKLMLARAMYKQSSVLILDEPTAALDPLAESRMYGEYRKITNGRSAIFISHRLASTKFCDRILYLENGEILEMGSHEELLQKNGKYAELFRVQSQYYMDEQNGTERET